MAIFGSLFKTKSAGQSISIRISGRAALEKRLRVFGKSIKNKAVKAALKEMGKPIAKGVAAAAPKDLKILSKNIKAKVLKSKRTKDWSLRVGPQNKKVKIVQRGRKRIKFTKSIKKKILAGKAGGVVRYANPSKYSHLVALGTKHGVKATDYLRKGLNSSKSAAVSAFIGTMKAKALEAAREAKSA